MIHQTRYIVQQYARIKREEKIKIDLDENV